MGYSTLLPAPRRCTKVARHSAAGAEWFRLEEGREQYIGFFHTGAYQESVGGYGGINHCLLPDPKWLIIDRDENGDLVERVFSEEQTADPMLRILGY